MKRPWQRRLKRATYAVLPPALIKYQIALRNYRRGEPEIRLLRGIVDGGRAAVDVGAYTGAYTFFLQRLARHVYVFEPQAACAAFLKRAYPRGVSVHAVALSDHEGCGTLARAGLHGEPSQSARLAAAQRGAPGDCRVEVRTLDGFGLDDVGFMKIDAEGEERRILDGARATIARCRPTMLVEIEDRHIAGDIAASFRHIESLGYRGSFLNDGKLEPLARFSVETMQRARLAGERTRPYINNFLFHPTGRG